ncbi:MAG: 2-C-methyl-D-erythritol 4-phosphate cytidylyltransferase [Eggerthellaceae bacterium]|nr:2-C-methyl-D-erythritol 4-phosphate cytidylyltransferase [Eggerthellaceae bacterium]
MNVALIIAGGVGSRMGKNIPKQFLTVNDKPILAYTLEIFEKHEEVDAIEVVCIDGWQDEVMSYKDKYGISKLKWMVTGGNTGQESIRNGVYNLENKIDADDIVIIHDGVRPMLEPSILSDLLNVCRLHGNAVSSMPYNEQIFLVSPENSSTTTEYIPREKLRRVVTPQAYRFGELIEAYREAFAKEIGIYGSSYTNTMMVELGKRLYFSAGSDKNMKLTTVDNLELFEAYLSSSREDR